MKYFFGPDTYGAREGIESVAKKENLPIRFLDKGDFEQQPLLSWLDSASSGLFGGELLVVRDACTFPKVLQEQVVDAVKDAKSQEKHLIIWDREKPDKRTEYFKVLKKVGQEFLEQSIPELAVWLKTQGSIDDVGARELVRRIGTDRWALKNELARLNLEYEHVSIPEVSQSVPMRDTSEEMFAALDALSAGNTQGAIDKIEQQLRTGESELYVLSMLAYQFKTLLAIRTRNTKGLHPFVVEKNSFAANRFSVDVLQNILTRISATDFSIKQGKLDARTALIMLVTTLVQTQTPSRMKG